MKVSFWRSFDYFSLLLTLSLLTIGLLVIYSIDLGESTIAKEGVFQKQVFFAIIGLFSFFLFSRLDYRYLKNLAIPIYLTSLALLVFTFIWGLETRGSTRWIEIGFLRIQPSEFIKLSLIIILSSLFSRQTASSLKNIIIPTIFTIIPTILIFKQPDLGSALIIGGILVGLVFCSGLKFKYILILGLLLTIITPLSWGLLKDYQKDRVLTFFNPSIDPLGRGYNVIQSVIAVGSGQIIGRGFGRGTQSHLNFLPESHTDFIFASLAEELGLIGTTILLIIAFILISRLFNLAAQVSNSFGALLVLGVAIMFTLQLFINIGMNIGLLPVTGITLPLISYGGSSLVTLLAALGMVQNVYRNSGKI